MRAVPELTCGVAVQGEQGKLGAVLEKVLQLSA